MPVQLTEAIEILPKIQCFFDLLVARYDENRYPPQVYGQLIAEFQNPEQVGRAQIENALRWKYARPFPRQLPNGHIQTIDRISENWQNQFQANGYEQRIAALCDPDQNANNFVSRAFLVHLCAPNELPIVDRFNHRAVRWFLGTVREDFELGGLPNNYEDIMLIQSFVNQLLAVWDNNGQNHQTLDRFLMMFGKQIAPPY